MEIEEYEKWFLDTSLIEFQRLSRKWLEVNLLVPTSIQGYDQWLNYWKTLPYAKIKAFASSGQDVLPVEAYAALMRWHDILQNPARIDKIYQAGLAKPKSDKKSISELAKSNDKLGVLYAIRDEIAEKLDRGTGARDTANLAREMSNIIDQINEAEKRNGPSEDTALFQILKNTKTKCAGIDKRQFRTMIADKESEDGED